MTYNIAYDLQHRIVKKGISQAPRKQAICCQVYPQARVYNRRWSHSITTILNSASFRQQRQSALTHPSKSPRNNSPSQQPHNRRLVLGLELSELFLTSALLHLMHLPTINHIDLSYIYNFPLSSLVPSVNLLRLDIHHLRISSNVDQLKELVPLNLLSSRR